MSEKTDLENDVARAWRIAREIVGPLSLVRQLSSANFLGQEEEKNKLEFKNEESAGEYAAVKEQADAEEESEKKEAVEESKNSEVASIEKMEVDENCQETSPGGELSIGLIVLTDGGRFFDDTTDAMDMDQVQVSGDDDSSTLGSDSCDDDFVMLPHCGTKEILDVQRLADILERAKQATAAIDHNSDVVIVLGATGVGKSTFIQAVSGKKIIRGWDRGMCKSSFAVEHMQGELEGFEIGHGLQSCTRHARSVYHETSSVHYVDSSGFGDTESIETDIATSISVREIAQRARRLRFIVLINAIQFYSERAMELKRNLEVVAKFIGHNFADHKKAFTFLFTHCDYAFEEARDLIKASSDSAVILSSMKQTLLALLSETRNATRENETRDLIKFLKKSLEENYPFCKVFDPVLSNISSICSDEKSAMPRKWILDPATHIKCSLTFASAHLIDREVKNRQAKILGDIEAGVLDHQLRQNILAIQTLSNQIDTNGAEWMNEINLALSRECHKLKDKIHHIVASGISPDLVDFDIDDAHAVRKNIDRLCLLRNLAHGCNRSDTVEFSADIVQSNEYGNLVSTLQLKMCWVEKEIGMFDNVLDGNQYKCQCLSAISLIMNKLSCWAVAFPGDITNTFEVTRNIVNEKLLGFVRNVRNGCFPASPQGIFHAVKCLAILKHIHGSGLISSYSDEPQEGTFTWLVNQVKELFKLFPTLVEVVVVEAFESLPSGEILIQGTDFPVNVSFRELMTDLQSLNEIIKDEKRFWGL